MEVHHHAHTKRKSFRHYLFEFFMLFLAVFCGFLAEYFLEHTIEHQREKQFIASMVKDLKDDTGRITKIIVYNKKQLQGLDNLLQLLHNKPTVQDSINKAYYLYRQYSLNYERVVFNTRTLTQLKNSGSMRLIRNQSVSDSIMNYDANIQNAELQFEVVKDTWKDQTTFSFQLFDLGGIQLKSPNPETVQWKFLTNDEKITTEYVSRLFMYAAVIIGYTQNIKEQKESASRLISFLEKEYHLN